MRITIYGSRPDAAAVEGDVVYFINGSIRDRKRFSSSTETFHIMANGGFQKAVLEVNKKEANKHVIECIRKAVSDKTILVGRGKIEPTISELNKIGYETGEFVFISNRDRDSLVRSIAHVVVPVGVRFSFIWGLKEGLYSLKRLINSIFLWYKERTNEVDWYVMYRPSNGVFALLHALSTFGLENEYILSGVGLQPWDYGYRKENGELLKRRKKRPHLLADRAILKAVAKSNIWTDDRFLSEQTGIRFLGDHSELGDFIEQVNE